MQRCNSLIMKFLPTANYLLLEPKKVEEKSTGGIILPQSALDSTSLNQGKIIAKGEFTPDLLSVGQTVLFKQHTEYRMKIDGEDKILVNSDDVIMYGAD